MRRTWTDFVRLTLMLAWDGVLKAKSAVVLSHRPLKVTERNRCGRWFCRDPFEEALVLEGASGYQTIYLLDGEETDALTGRSLHARLQADVYRVTVEENGEKTVFPIWGIVGCRGFADAEDVEARLQSELRAVVAAANRGLGAFEEGVTVCGGGVVPPTLEAGRLNESNGVVTWRLSPTAPDLQTAARVIAGRRGS